MKKKPALKINIPSPCTAPWSEMRPVEGGRFCDSCVKKIVDFSTWTDREIVQYVRNNQSACGRFHVSQLNRDLLHLEKERANSFIPALLVSTALAAGVASNASASAKAEPSQPLSAQIDTIPSFPIDTPDVVENYIPPDLQLNAKLFRGDGKSPEEAQFERLTWPVISWGWHFRKKPILDEFLETGNKDTSTLSDYNTDEGKRRMLELGIKVDPARQPDIKVKEEEYRTGFFGPPNLTPEQTIPAFSIPAMDGITPSQSEDAPSLFRAVKYDGELWPAISTNDVYKPMPKVELKPLELPEFRLLPSSSKKKRH